MSDKRKYVNELIRDAAYNAVINSELFNLPNAKMDAHTEALFAKLRAVVDDYLIQNEASEYLTSVEREEQLETVS